MRALPRSLAVLSLLLCSCGGETPTLPLSLHVPALVAILPGGTATATIALSPVGEPVEVKATGLPTGVTLDPVTIPPNANRANLVFHAPDAAPLGTVSVVLAATGDGWHGAAEMLLGIGLTGGTPDGSFGVAGVATLDMQDEGAAAAVAVAPDGKVVLAGSSSPESYFEEPTFKIHPFMVTVARLGPDGTPDATFAAGGVGEIDAGRALAATLDDRGWLLVSGIDETGHGALWRVGGSGALDPTFGSGGKLVVAETYRIVAATPDASGIRALGSNNTGYVALRLDESGARDATYGENGAVTGTMDSVHFWSANLTPDGGWLVAAETKDHRGAVLRIGADGHLDEGFGSGGIATMASSDLVLDVATSAAGLVAVGQDDSHGSYEGFGQSLFMWLLPGGGLNSSIATGGSMAFPVSGPYEWGQRVRVVDDGKLVILVVANYLGAARDQLVVRLAPDGTLDPTFGIGGQFSLRDLANQGPVRAANRNPRRDGGRCAGPDLHHLQRRSEAVGRLAPALIVAPAVRAMISPMKPNPILLAFLCVSCGTATQTAPPASPATQPSPPAAPQGALPPDAEHAKEALAKSPRHGEWVDVKSADGTKLATWVVYPEKRDKAGAVIVIHEIFGLTDWARGVADQLAKDGFIALAPDLVSGMGPNGGGTESLGEDVGKTIRTLTPDAVAARLDAVRAYALALPAANGKLGVVGFCWGGGASFNYAVAQPRLDAAVVFYGVSPSDPAAYAKIGAPVLGHYGGDDARVNATIPTAQAEMTKLKKSYTAKVYDGAGHGFLRQLTGRDGANLRAAEQAWPATIELFRQRLK